METEGAVIWHSQWIPFMQQGRNLGEERLGSETGRL